MAAARTTRLLLAACLAGVTACSNNNNPQAPNPPAPVPGIMNASVDGLGWSAGGISGSPAAAAYSPTGPSILIVGHRIFANGSGSNVTLHVEAFTGAGTYTLKTGALSGARAIFASYTAALDTTKYTTDAGHTGTLTVTLFDTFNRDVRGTFSFTGLDPTGTVVANVTSGFFDVSF